MLHDPVVFIDRNIDFLKVVQRSPLDLMRKELRLFHRKSLKLLPLGEREHDMSFGVVKEPETVLAKNIPTEILEVAKSVISAKQKSGAIIFMMGAHVLRSGVQRYIIDLMERGYISCIAMNGGGMIHDYELALIGASTESVTRYIAEGQFGLWKETGIINDIINRAFLNNPESGLGEVVGRAILEGEYPYKEISVLASAARLGVPVTIHVGIGYDIIHEHPNCNGAATGALSYNDFLKFAAVVQYLENGVVMNFGSAVMAPEVFLKALSMARNVAHQNGHVIRNFCTLVCDLKDLSGDLETEPPKDSAAYYFRPWKTMLVRTVKDGGVGFYVKGAHAETIPALWSAIDQIERTTGNLHPT